MEIDPKKLRRYRLAVPLTQEELARKAGVSEGTVLRLEKGLPGRPSTLRKIAKALKVKPVELTASQTEE